MRPKLTLEERFWSKVAKATNPDGCWLWQACRTPAGYGFFSISGKNQLAHRVCWELTHGAIPGELQVCHRCDVPSCVNPDHLFLGTNRENMADCKAKGRLATGERQGTWTHPESRAKGEQHGCAKLTWDDIHRIRARRASGEGLGPIAADYGVTRAAISAIARGHLWRE